METAAEELQTLVRHAPETGSRWTLTKIREAIHWLEDRSLSCVWKTLVALGIVYKRGREAIHSPDPSYDLKLAYVKEACQQAQCHPERVVVLYEDELTYYRRPSLARAYALQGSKDPKAWLGHTANKKRRIAGSLNWFTGQFHAQQRYRFGVTALKHYYQELQGLYPEAEVIYLVQDNWPVHRHPELLEFFLHSRLVPLYLPTYAPWTNPVEKVWLRLKQELLHLHSFADDWLALQTAVQVWLDRWLLPSPDLLHYVGLTPY